MGKENAVALAAEDKILTYYRVVYLFFFLILGVWNTKNPVQSAAKNHAEEDKIIICRLFNL